MRADIQNRVICVLTEVKSGLSSKIRTISLKSGRLDTLIKKLANRKILYIVQFSDATVNLI